MKLRTRLAVSAMAVTLPTVLALFWFDRVAHHRAAERILTESIYAHMLREREACEADPASFGGQLGPNHGPGAPPPGGPPEDAPPPPPAPPHEPAPHRGPPPPKPPGDPEREHALPPLVFAYDEAFRSQNPKAPVLSDELIGAIQGHEVAIVPFAWRSRRVEVLLRMPWTTGPCSFVWARGTTDASWGAILPDTELWLLPVAAVFVAVLLSVGPVIRRIRKLTEAVHRSASTDYASTIHLGGEDEIGELARAFNTAGKEIRAQIEERDRREQALRHFVANTTHDVMIPLTVLKGHLTTLRESAARGALGDDVAVLISAMDEAHYMASLMHNLAVAARLEAAEVKLQRSEVNLNALVARVIGRHAPIARELEISLESAVPPEPIEVWADVTLLEQAVSNVVYNAIRYNRSGGHVAVILERTSEDAFCLQVIDDGPGIAAEELSKLAERGFRGSEARTRAPEGQGLGLHIAYSAAELHGFSLTLEPSEYGGLEVRLEGSLSRS